MNRISPQSSWSGYKEYYSSDITKNALTKVQEGTNWAIEDGVIRRKAQESGMDDCRKYLDMAYLYLNDKKYTNFRVWNWIIKMVIPDGIEHR